MRSSAPWRDVAEMQRGVPRIPRDARHEPLRVGERPRRRLILLRFATAAETALERCRFTGRHGEAREDAQREFRCRFPRRHAPLCERCCEALRRC